MHCVMPSMTRRPQGLWRSLPIVLSVLSVGWIGVPPAAQAAENSSSSAAGKAIPASTKQQKELAKHLKLKGAVLYGAWWCPHCTHQKELFGFEAIELLPYVECDKDADGRAQCQQAQVRAYPTWELNGERRVGVLSLQELEIWSGYGSR
jgi:glutaredoxin